MRKFSDFAQNEHQLEGDKIPISDVIDKEVVVTSFRIQESKYRDNQSDNKLLTIQVKVDGQVRVLFTGSAVLRKQIEQYEDQLPFIATIKRINKYLTFT